MFDEEVREDGLPEPTEAEKAAVIDKFLKNDASYRRLYEDAPPMAKRRLEIAFWVSEYRNKRNMWPIRELRAVLERDMDRQSIAYLAARFPGESGREHYRELLAEHELRKTLTHERMLKIIAKTANEDDRDAYLETLEQIESIGDAAVMVDKLRFFQAISGSVHEQTMLGDAFDHEHEVTRNARLAGFWFRKAGDGGDEDSRRRYEQLARNGLA